MSDNRPRHLRTDAPKTLGFPPAAPPPPHAMLPQANGVNGPPVVPPYQAPYPSAPPAPYAPLPHMQYPHAPLPHGHPPPQGDPSPQWSYNGASGNVAHQSPPAANRSHTSTAYTYMSPATSNPQHRAPAPPAPLRSTPFSSTTATTGNSYHANYPNTASSRASGAAVRSSARGATAPTVTLNSFTQIRDDLARYSDDSHLIGRFAQYLGEHQRIPSSHRRATILNFSGFCGSHVPKANILCHLNKGDLDSLALALGLQARGRKMDIANRIGSALRAPLFSKHGHSAMPPTPAPAPTPTRLALAQSTPRTSNAAAYVAGLPPGSLYVGNNARSNMPAMPPGGAYAAHRLPRSAAPPRRRTRELIHSPSQLMVPETPFNQPLSEPLGDMSPTHALFTSADLSKNQEPRITFHSPNFEDFEMSAKGKGNVQVHLRCLKVEPAKDPSTWKQGWPFPAAARINNFNVDLDQAQRFTNGKLAGVDKATDITRFLRGRRDRHILNTVTLRRSAHSSAAANGTFVLFAQVVLVKSASAMQELVKQNSAKYWYDLRQQEVSRGMDPTASDYELSRRQVEALMSGDDGIAVASQKVSLKCPLSLVPISIPVRARSCTHIQCVDLTSYLDYTRRSTKFLCPVCNVKSAAPDELVISPYIEHALKNYSGNDEIEVTADGAITAVENLRTGVASADSDDEFDEPSSKRRKPNEAATGASGGGGNSVVVDLTLDSDDDDVAPAQPASAEQQPPVNAFVPPQAPATPAPPPSAPLTPALTTSTVTLTQASTASTPNADSFIVPAPAQTPPAEEETVGDNTVDKEANWMFEGSVAREAALPDPDAKLPEPEAELPEPEVASPAPQPERDEFDTFNHTFSAPNQGIYPWDLKDSGDVTDSDDEGAGGNVQTDNDGDSRHAATGGQQNASDSGPVFENGIEVICIDD